MKTLLLSLFAASILACNNSQLSTGNSTSYDQETKQFLQFINQQYFQGDSFQLATKPDWREIKGCLESILQDSSIFTATEKKQISEQMENQRITNWSALDVSHARLIPTDTIDAIFADRNKGWKYFHATYGQGFSKFSAPVFIRNNSFCLFYYDKLCGGLCGTGQVILFEKSGNSWKEVKSYCRWIS